jgi:hypothetical protein
VAADGVPLKEMPVELAKRLPRYPSVPVSRLGCLAVDVAFLRRQLIAATAVSAHRVSAMKRRCIPVVWKKHAGTRLEFRLVIGLPLTAAEEAQLDARAEAACEAGPVVSHERVRKWLSLLSKAKHVQASRPNGETVAATKAASRDRFTMAGSKA